jgi:hypothetical protein
VNTAGTLDPIAARAIADAHRAAPRVSGPETVAAYGQIIEETDRLFHLLAVDVVFTMSSQVGGAYDRFRAVHGVLGHGHLGVGFDRDGAYATWRFQERRHSPVARRALATELHAEHSVRWTTGELAEHKAVLLDERIVARFRAGLDDRSVA